MRSEVSSWAVRSVLTDWPEWDVLWLEASLHFSKSILIKAILTRDMLSCQSLSISAFPIILLSSCQSPGWRAGKNTTDSHIRNRPFHFLPRGSSILLYLGQWNFNAARFFFSRLIWIMASLISRSPGGILSVWSFNGDTSKLKERAEVSNSDRLQGCCMEPASGLTGRPECIGWSCKSPLQQSWPHYLINVMLCKRYRWIIQKLYNEKTQYVTPNLTHFIYSVYMGQLIGLRP